jgi:hypothetical protein
VPLGGNSFAVFAQPPTTYPIGGVLPVTVVIRDVGGAAATAVDTATVLSNVAIPPLTPIYQADSGPVTFQYLALQSALTNLLTAADNALFSQYEPIGTRLPALENLVIALLQYEEVAYQFDIRLPLAPNVPAQVPLLAGQFQLLTGLLLPTA